MTEEAFAAVGLRGLLFCRKRIGRLDGVWLDLRVFLNLLRGLLIWSYRFDGSWLISWLLNGSLLCYNSLYL